MNRTSAKLTELTELPPTDAELQERNLQGEYFLVRNAMQQLAVFEELRQASLRGFEKALGIEARRKIEAVGFEKTHEVVPAADIPKLTDAAYAEVTRAAPAVLRRMVPRLFGHMSPFYFEHSPNVRFHIPYDSAAPMRKAYAEFGKKRGEGKITAHGPHRDSWLECPTNCVNVWVAMGRVSPGNGLLIYPEVYGQPIERDGCHITKQAAPGTPTNSAMNPGDAIIFHGDQVHGSVLNHCDETRHAISFRLCLSRPRYRDLHIHDYSLSTLAVGPFANGPLSWVAEVPAKISRGYVRTRLWQVGRKLGLTQAPPAGSQAPAKLEKPELKASELQPGQIKALDQKTCVARTQTGELVAFSRRCTHEGADLALGYVDGDTIRCPWHNVPFDTKNGRSPCEALHPLKLRQVDVDENDLVSIRTPTAAE